MKRKRNYSTCCAVQILVWVTRINTRANNKTLLRILKHILQKFHSWSKHFIKTSGDVVFIKFLRWWNRVIWIIRILSYYKSTGGVNQRHSVEIWLTYLLTYSMVQSSSWAADWLAASQEIPRISRNPKVHHRTHKRTPPVPILGQPNPVHMPTSHLLEIHPNIIHPSTPRSPQWDLADTQLKLLLGCFYACYGRKHKSLDP